MKLKNIDLISLKKLLIAKEMTDELNHIVEYVLKSIQLNEESKDEIDREFWRDLYIEPKLFSKYNRALTLVIKDLVEMHAYSSENQIQHLALLTCDTAFLCEQVRLGIIELKALETYILNYGSLEQCGILLASNLDGLDCQSLEEKITKRLQFHQEYNIKLQAQEIDALVECLLHAPYQEGHDIIAEIIVIACEHFYVPKEKGISIISKILTFFFADAKDIYEVLKRRPDIARIYKAYVCDSQRRKELPEPVQAIFKSHVVNKGEILGNILVGKETDIAFYLAVLGKTGDDDSLLNYWTSYQNDLAIATYLGYMCDDCFSLENYEKKGVLLDKEYKRKLAEQKLERKRKKGEQK